MAAATARFVNPIPNPARYQKYNGVNLETLCMAAYQGDLERLEVLLRKASHANNLAQSPLSLLQIPIPVQRATKTTSSMAM